MTIGNHLVERKGLKQVEIRGLKEGFIVTHQIKSVTWINQQIHILTTRSINHSNNSGRL